MAETRVLVALCNGTPPLEGRPVGSGGRDLDRAQPDRQHPRSKTGAQSIRALVRQIAVLPPVKGVLRGHAMPIAGWFGPRLSAA